MPEPPGLRGSLPSAGWVAPSTACPTLVLTFSPLPYSHTDLSPGGFRSKSNRGIRVKFIQTQYSPHFGPRGPPEMTVNSVLNQVTCVSMTEEHVGPTRKSRWLSQSFVRTRRPLSAGLPLLDAPTGAGLCCC